MCEWGGGGACQGGECVCTILKEVMVTACPAHVHSATTTSFESVRPAPPCQRPPSSAPPPALWLPLTHMFCDQAGLDPPPSPPHPLHTPTLLLHTRSLHASAHILNPISPPLPLNPLPASSGVAHLASVHLPSPTHPPTPCTSIHCCSPHTFTASAHILISPLPP